MPAVFQFSPERRIMLARRQLDCDRSLPGQSSVVRLVCHCFVLDGLYVPADIICLQETKLGRSDLTRDVAVAEGW